MKKEEILVPFLKWAGGKRWLVQDYSHLFPATYGRYLEPFLGSAVVFFHLKPKQAVLADINGELINTYRAIRERPDLVARYLLAHDRKHAKHYYYDVRQSSRRSLYSRAARTIYLNRTCWNALYRVNLKGQFNVPIGSKSSAMLPTDNFVKVAKLLKNADLRACDFEAVIDETRKNDFVFIDPPYTVKHNLNGFLKYNEKIFSWADQERLRNAVERAVGRGVKVLVTNADHSSVRQLYKGFSIARLHRVSLIAASAEHRGLQSELAIQCW